MNSHLAIKIIWSTFSSQFQRGVNIHFFLMDRHEPVIDKIILLKLQCIANLDKIKTIHFHN